MNFVLLIFSLNSHICWVSVYTEVDEETKFYINMSK